MSDLLDPVDPPLSTAPRVGRPRRGTESQRTAQLLAAATRVFLRDGYAQASIDKVAAEAGVSTRTIYERFKNKADLLSAVITRLVERDMQSVLATADLDRLDPKEGLMRIAMTITRRVRDPESGALFRIVATEAQRFPDLAEKMRDSKRQWESAVGNYFSGQMARGTLQMSDPQRSAVLFLQMICAELHECLLFGSSEAMGKIDFSSHAKHVVDVFLFGAAPRADRPITVAYNL
jgi:TetR/AcrR family transcriptional regulator, mexJK operon transcriptional repressor